jgi:hypothetical protein
VSLRIYGESVRGKRANGYINKERLRDRWETEGGRNVEER